MSFIEFSRSWPKNYRKHVWIGAFTSDIKYGQMKWELIAAACNQRRSFVFDSEAFDVSCITILLYPMYQVLNFLEIPTNRIDFSFLFMNNIITFPHHYVESTVMVTKFLNADSEIVSVFFICQIIKIAKLSNQ